MLREHAEDVLPQDAVSLYHSYAQDQLAQAAADEQAGSMALYGLGKVYSRLAERRDDDVQCVRGAMTMYCAALDACPDNNLAANELGVLLCRTGHPAEAVTNFVRAIDVSPNATAYHNLAVAQAETGVGVAIGGQRTRIAAAGGDGSSGGYGFATSRCRVGVAGRIGPRFATRTERASVPAAST